jgi:hypothetical protein
MKYEYKHITDITQMKLIEALNKRDMIGWELVSVIYNPNGGCYVAFLKRPVPSASVMSKGECYGMV